jgi:MoaA/NifB/PqqE/SkfB family radical SAM enzyme
MATTEFFKYTIELLEVENSSICNAECPQCTRQGLGDDRSWFKQDYLRLEVFENIPDEIWAGIKKVSFAGTMGDPCAAPNFIQIINWIRNKCPNAFINVETNGGLKSAQFWKRLARSLDGHGRVQFAIDGLNDTNHIYRVRVDWGKLMANVKAFIDEGGDAAWQFIVFKHNEHQVDEARQMALDLGFTLFNIKKSHRFVFDEIFQYSKLGSGNIPIQPPSNEVFVHPVLLTKTKPATLNGMIEDAFGKCISCFVKDEKSLYLDHLGRLFPCCFIGGSIYMYEYYRINDAWNEIWDNYGKDKISLYNHGWHEILDGEFFARIEESWTAIKKENTIFVCGTTCSNSTEKCNNPEEFGKLTESLAVKNT